MAARLALLLLAALLAAVSAAPITNRAAQWNAWKAEYGRAYASPAEEAKRQKIWNGNMDFIDSFDAKAKTFTVGMNQFGDLTLGEFASQMNNFFRNPNKVYHYANLSGVAVPSTMDWRTKGVVTAVKNQGQCGSCWSFSSTGSIEGAHAIATGSLVSLSEQNLIDCSSSYGNQGCNGGEMDDAFKYVIANGGIDTESSYPYNAAQGKCHYATSNSGATISNYQDVQHDETSLMNAVGSVGPVSVAIDASHQSFQFYTSGIYYEPQCSTTQLDHGVLTVGYGAQGSQDYWIVKNSWGPTWGLQGYIWMSRNRNNNCGIASDPSYPIVSGGGGTNSNTNSGNSNSNSNSASSAGSSAAGVLRNHM